MHEPMAGENHVHEPMGNEHNTKGPMGRGGGSAGGRNGDINQHIQGYTHTLIHSHTHPGTHTHFNRRHTHTLIHYADMKEQGVRMGSKVQTIHGEPALCSTTQTPRPGSHPAGGEQPDQDQLPLVPPTQHRPPHPPPSPPTARRHVPQHTLNQGLETTAACSHQG